MEAKNASAPSGNRYTCVGSLQQHPHSISHVFYVLQTSPLMNDVQHGALHRPSAHGLRCRHHPRTIGYESITFLIRYVEKQVNSIHLTLASRYDVIVQDAIDLNKRELQSQPSILYAPSKQSRSFRLRDTYWFLCNFNGVDVCLEKTTGKNLSCPREQRQAYTCPRRGHIYLRCQSS